MIIETCPECGCDLLDIMLTSYPPIPQKLCPRCGWSWTGKPEEVVRVPFGGNSYTPTRPLACEACPNNSKNGGSGVCHCILGSEIRY